MVALAIDLDGVLGAFDEHVESLFGGPPRGLTFDCPERGLIKGDAALWAHVGQTPDFWEAIPVKEGAYELFEVALPYKPTILTGCPRDGYDVAAAHKVQWIAKHFAAKYGVEVPVITCFSRDKALHMKNPGDILVDDFIVNIKRWQQAGGSTVWYRDAQQAITDLKAKIARAERRGE